MSSGILAIVSGPSAAGKGTVAKRALNLAEERGLDIHLSISMTTRSMKKNEQEGVTYFYVDRESFMKFVGEGGMIEYNEYNGNLYGTPRKIVEEKLAEGHSVILEIDVNGADQVLREFPNATRIFIMPPSLDELRDRIKKRGRDTSEEIELRLTKAREEIPRAEEYDYIIINDIIEEAAEDLLNIISAEKNSVKHKKYIIDKVLG